MAADFELLEIGIAVEDFLVTRDTVVFDPLSPVPAPVRAIKA
jgi:hypothetical protein